MSSIQRVGDLDIAQDLRFSRRSWVVQRIAWVIGSLLLIGAAAGLFGRGPLSKAEAESDAGDLHVEYERFARHQGRTQLEITVDPADPQAAEVRVWISRAAFDAGKLQNIMPEPDFVEAASERLTLVFRREPDSGPFRISVESEVEEMGPQWTELGVVGGSQVGFRQFLYP